jgi:hypothetical protein
VRARQSEEAAADPPKAGSVSRGWVESGGSDLGTAGCRIPLGHIIPQD